MRIASLTLALNFFHGASIEKVNSLPNPSNSLSKYSELVPRDQGAIAPSEIEIELSGITNSSSTTSRVPIPSHSPHAPKGELKEKDLGSNSSMEISHFIQAIFSLKLFSRFGDFTGSSTNSRITIPLASFSAVSTESVNLCCELAFALNLSTTTSIVCFSCFLSSGISSKVNTFPSTLALENPCKVKSLNRSTNSPLRARTIGAST